MVLGQCMETMRTNQRAVARSLGASQERVDTRDVKRGLAVVPLLAGLDPEVGRGRIVSYDVTGGRYEERDHHAVGSGAAYARGSLKKRWRRGLDGDAAVRVVVEALVDAADDDAATGGPDALRDIWPVVVLVTPAGAVRVSDDVLASVTGAVLAERQEARA